MSLLPGAAADITLLWEANPEEDVTYRVHYGVESGIYSTSIDVGNVTSATVTGLKDQRNYFFVVTAVNEAGIESLPSSEVANGGLENQRPTVTLSSATEGQLVPEPATIRFDIDGFDADGSLAYAELLIEDLEKVDSPVEFVGPIVFVDGHATFDLPDLQAGIYSVIARAIDTEGGTGLSNEIKFTVRALALSLSLETGVLHITEGGMLPITNRTFRFTAQDASLNTLVFTATGVTAGTFFVNGSPVSEFSGPDLLDGSVQFAHDGSETAAAFQLQMSDGIFHSEVIAPVIQFRRINDAPEIDQFAFAVVEGGTALLTPVDVDDPDTPLIDIEFRVTESAHGTVHVGAATSDHFSWDDLVAGSVTFHHDGSEFAPSLSINAWDGKASGEPKASTIEFTRVNDSPMLTVSLPAIVEGTSMLLTSEHFSTSDPETPDELVFTVADTVAGSFFVDETQVNAFSVEQLATGRVSFQHDGSERPPQFTIHVSDPDGLFADAGILSPEFIRVNDPPTLTVASMRLHQGQTLVLGSEDILASDPDTSIEALLFSMTDILGGSLQIGGSIAAGTGESATFTPAQLAAGEVAFVHDGSLTFPAFSLSLTDGLTDAVTQAPVLQFFRTPAITQLSVLANGVVSIQIEGTPGDQISVEASSDLMHWSPLGTVSLQQDIEQFLDVAPLEDIGGNPIFYQLNVTY